MRNLAIVLIAIGILALVVPYVVFTKKDKILDIGPIEAVKTEKQTLPVAPIVGIVIIGAGLIVLLGSATRK